MVANADALESYRSPRYRWECDCKAPPVLLARYEPGGVVEIKVRDRWFYVHPGGARITAICPVCGKEHTLEMGDVN